MNQTTDVFRAWHILPTNRKLRYEDNREVVDGETLSVVGAPILCQCGMHASLKVRDALKYAPGSVFTLVEVSGNVVLGDDKLVGQSRKVLWSCSAKRGLTLIVAFANWCAQRAKIHAAYAAADAANAAYAAADAANAAYAAADAANAAYAAATAAADAYAAERQEQETWLITELRKLGAPV